VLRRARLRPVGRDDTPLDLAASLEELEVVVEASAEPRVALLGISGGAATAVAYAARHPQRVSHLVLLGGYTHGLLQRAHPKAWPTSRPWPPDAARLGPAGLGRAAVLLGLADPRRHARTARGHERAAAPSCDGQRAAAIFRARSQLDVRPLLPRVQCPTLVMHCEGDAMVKVELGRDLAAAMAGARFEALHSRNHVPLHGEPAFERFCEAVTDFVHQRPPADRPGLHRA
jgi:pimeloyl-ACP methyl ester carboxylesterase